MTGKHPFAEHPYDLIVLSAVVKGTRPSRPSFVATQRGLTDPLWTLIEKCWSGNPEERPSMSSCLNELERYAEDFSRRLLAEWDDMDETSDDEVLPEYDVRRSQLDTAKLKESMSLFILFSQGANVPQSLKKDILSPLMRVSILRPVTWVRVGFV